MNHNINEEHIEYYQILEKIRKSGICNMFGAAAPLRTLQPELSETEAVDILAEWIQNYKELNKRFNWQN